MDLNSYVTEKELMIELEKLIKYLEDESLEDMKMNNDINELKGFNKVRGIPSAVQIAVTISAYAKISINEYKNIKNNTCIYSDTDSVILKRNYQMYLA